MLHLNIVFVPELFDYKFFCFNGHVQCFKIDFGRFCNHRDNYYEANCNILPFGEMVCPPDYDKHIDMPANIAQMIKSSEKLANHLPFVRIDFYNNNGNVYFGEMTFFPDGGFGELSSKEWEMNFGDWLKFTAIKIC